MLKDINIKGTSIAIKLRILHSLIGLKLKAESIKLATVRHSHESGNPQFQLPKYIMAI